MLDVATKKKVLYKFIKDRIDHNKNCIILIDGETGSGKTYTGLRLAVDLSEIFGTEFTIQKNMDFNFVKLLEKMRLPGKDVPGNTFLFEEVGSVDSGADSQEWQKKENQFFSSFMQTSRHKRQIFIMTCPMFTNLQKKTRELCHMEMSMVSINPQTKLSTVRPFRIQVNRTSGKMYMKYLRFRYDGIRYRLGRVEFELPPKDIITQYENAKTNFTDSLNQKIIDYGKPKLKPLTERQELYMELYNKGLSDEEIATKMGMHKNQNYKNQFAIKKKGYILERRAEIRKKKGLIIPKNPQKQPFDLTSDSQPSEKNNNNSNTNEEKILKDNIIRKKKDNDISFVNDPV